MAVFLKTKPVTKSTTFSPDLSPVSSTSSSSDFHVTQKTLRTYSHKVANTFSEICKAYCKGLSNNSSSNISPIFEVIFPDSKIVESFALGKDKSRYLITYGIAPYFYELLKDNVNNSNCYTVLFDESLNRISQTSQMDILLRYWDTTAKMVKIQFCNSSYLGHVTYKDLLESYNCSVSDLDLLKMIQLPMDRANVNWKFA